MSKTLPPLPEPSMFAEYWASDMQAYALAALEQQRQIEAQGVPDGWQLVPKEPTPEMKTAGLDAGEEAYNQHIANALCDGPTPEYETSMEAIYSAMLASAPPAPQKGESNVV